MEKYCKSCDTTKPLTDFFTNGWYKGKRKYKPTCRICERRDARVTALEVIEEHFGGWICQKCGFEGHPPQFDCHHRDPTEKEFQISRVVKRAINSRLRYIAELEKCDLLCACCHRMEHVDIDRY